MTTPRRKACVECRQQKIRCDVEQHKTPHEPCTRCNKMKLECRILPTSTRNLRQTKAEMRRELEELRWNMRQGGSTHDPVGAQSTPGSGSNIDGHVFQSPGDHPSGTFSTASAEGTDVSASMSPHLEAKGEGGARTVSAPRPTLPRALDGYLVDAKRINDCFALYFTQYHPLLPILDSSSNLSGPNDYYDLSPFLFWSIIVTGSRKYSDDPTILDRISQLITPLAFSSMALRSAPISVVQGLLILCTWRLPTNSMYKDMTHVLCGAAVHLATQIGLHIAGVGQDFARTALKKDQDQKIFRAKLWMHCVIVSIRTSCAEGIPPLVIAETFFDGDGKEREDTLAFVPPSLQLSHKIHIILHRALVAMSRTNLKSIECDVGVLRSLIGIFDSQLLSLAASSPSDLDTFQLTCARVHVLAFHFFAHPTNPGPDAELLSRVYSLCISMLQTTKTLTQEMNFAFISQSFIDRTVSLAGFIILKLCRSPLSKHLDVKAGEQAYLNAAEFSKSTSLQNHDIGARCEAILKNLWGSTKVFRRRNGDVESLGLRLRTRLSMSVSFDMFWYWREEFAHLVNPYNGEENATSTAQTQPTTPDCEKERKGEAHVADPPAAPLTKFDVNAVPQLQPNPATMSFDTWDRHSDYSVPPMLDQFPDYDWAASFNFANEWGTVPMQIPGATPNGCNFG